MKELKVEKLALAMLKKRNEGKLSRKRASAEIGISVATIGRIECCQLRKSVLPDLDVYYKCCVWLGVKMETYFE